MRKNIHTRMVILNLVFCFGFHLIFPVTFNEAYGQGNCCQNINFSDGFSFWQLFTGNADSCCPHQVSGSQHHHIYNASSSYSVPQTNHQLIIGSGLDIAGLGDTLPNFTSAKIRREFCIDNVTCYLLLRYSFVQSGLSLPPEKQPGMFIIITDSAGQPLVGLPDTVSVTASSSNPSDTIIHANGDTVLFWNWDSIVIATNSYIGQHLIISVFVRDAIDSIHYGFGFFTAACIPCIGLSIGQIGGCFGDSVAQLVAPGGFVSYLWSNGDTTQTTFVTLPMVGPAIVTLTDIAGQITTLFTTISYTDVHAFFEISDSCYNSITLNSLSYATPVMITEYWWSIDSVTGYFSGGSQVSLNVPGPGTYLVFHAVKTSNGCWDTIMQSINAVDIPKPMFDFAGACEGEDVILTNTSTNIGSAFNSTWVFDGNNISSYNFFISGLNPNTYQISLIMESLTTGCINTLDSSFVVYPSTNIEFQMINAVCESDSIINLNDYIVADQPGTGQAYNYAFVSDSLFLTLLAGSGIHSFKWVYQSTYGCIDTLDVTIAVKPMPQVSLSVPQTICENSTPVNLLDYVSTQDTGWFEFTGPGMHGTYFFPEITGPGNFQIMMIFHNWFTGCFNKQPLLLKVASSPMITSPINRNICFSETPWIPVDGEPSGGWTESIYLSDDGRFHPLLWGPGEFEFTYFIQDGYGCINSVQYLLSVQNHDCFCSFYVPNTFTPNRDYINEVFKPSYHCEIIRYDMKIYNRWGQLLYRGSDINEGWDGYFHGEPCKHDVYIYKIDYQGVHSNMYLEPELISEKLTGWVYLLR